MGNIGQKTDENFRKLQAQLEAAKNRVSSKIDYEISRWEKVVGPVKDFKGVISRF